MSIDPAPGPAADAPTRLASVSGCLPALDEEGNVVEAITGLLAALGDLADEVEVILVDDGSTDRTAPLAEGLAAEDSRVRVVRHPTNLGYGTALASLIRAARHEWIFFTDADLQFDPAQLVAFVPYSADHDLVAGYRPDRRDPPHRRFMSWTWNRIVSGTLGVPLRDVNCAFKLMRRSVVSGIALESRGAMACAELAVKAERAGARIVELPVEHRERVWGSPTGGNPRVVLTALEEWARFLGGARR